MNNILTALSLSLFSLPLLAQGAPPQAAADQPYTMEYYYKVQWGHQQEFLQLFLKNHYPLLQKNVEGGRMLSVKIETPANHMTEDARWDYRVTIRFKNSTAATTPNPQEEALTKQLYPDQETFKREEQRRFQILLAHWDLPVTDITPAKK
jgi:glucan phosphorylase